MVSSPGRWALAACGIISVFSLQSAWANRSAEIEAALRAFDSNPSKAMSAPLPKRDRDGRVVRGTESAFSRDDIHDGDFVTHRDTYRKKLCKEAGGARVCLEDLEPGRAAYGMDDRVENLVDNRDSVLRTLEEMEEKRLTRATLAESPWSDDYWAIYKGVLGARYADVGFPGDKDWSKNKDYVTDASRTVTAILSANNSSSVDKLSPSEKYDLLVGDSNQTLTRTMWQEGEQYFRQSGKVEEWMGICHGWAAASYLLPRPTSAITVTAADGRTKIKFYPSEIKSLASLIWAKTEAPTRFIGGRCNDKDPKTDANGRVISQRCFDTNPGTWHMAVVNQIGVSKRSLIIDATYDYEVWNQPVHAYSYSYFNPQTGRSVRRIEDAKVALSDYTKDKFKKYRAGEAKHVVGVSMDVTYVIETNPTQAPTDSSARDGLRTATYMYDVELDANGTIIGGEWYTNLHPDFLWTPPAGTRVTSVADRFLGEKWDGNGPVPASYGRAASRASQYGQPLAAVLETLVTLSRVK